MDKKFAAIEIERLLKFAEKFNLLEKDDIIPSRNALIDILQLKEPYEGDIESNIPDSPSTILNKLLDYCAETGILKDNTITCRDLFDTRIMGLLMPRQSSVIKDFWRTRESQGIEKATDNFYALSRNSNYIRMDRIDKNLYWETETEYGNLEITINLSKPEKDPKEIAAARQLLQNSYPKCLLCIDNAGYAGNLNHPARQNLRVIPVTLNREQWYFQYSPYVYYNEHCIVFHGQHIPMKISDNTLLRLFDFIDLFPHYFIGSNADLPIVGGSILNHEHFQGGRHTFPMEKAAIDTCFTHPLYPGINAGIVKWPLSTLRLSGESREDIIKLSADILKAWKGYSDESVGIYAYTESNNKKVSHNTITPIARKNSKGEYELDLVFRNNRTSEFHPEGIYHPHRELHHIKKENIGLIEVMGLAVLPGRLNSELEIIKSFLTGEKPFNKHEFKEEDSIYKHIPWIEEMIKLYGTTLSSEEAAKYLQYEVGQKFLNVLLDSGVYKRSEEGRKAFSELMIHLGFIL